MAEEQVKQYYARWSPTNHNGYVVVFWDDGSKSFVISTPVEFQIVVDLLRNEEPIWWDEDTQRLYAWREPVGEGE